MDNNESMVGNENIDELNLRMSAGDNKINIMSVMKVIVYLKF